LQLDWRQEAKNIVADALDMDEEARRQLIDVRCAGNTSMRAEVEKLLFQYDHAGGITETQPGPASELSTELQSGTPQAPPRPMFLPGDVVASRFHIRALLGRGGMGEVYEAMDSELNDSIALKVVRQDIPLNETDVSRLIQELQLARKVTHPNVCRLYDIGRHFHPGGDIAFLTMELLKGETLASRLKTNGPFDAESVLKIGRYIASAIDAAHDQGIIHRDLKPSNIMLTAEGRVVITDFGIARMRSTAGGFTSGAHRILGTPAYMSPEQLGGRATAASDIYAFGMIIHEMLTGKRLAQLVSELAPPMPKEWEAILEKTIHVNPSRRFKTASEVIGKLERALKDPTEKDSRFNPKNISRRAAIVAIGAVPATAAAFTVAVLAGRGINFQIDAFEIDNQTGQPDLDYLCRGTTTELIRRLSHVSGVHVFPLYSTRSNTPQHEENRFSLDGILQKNGGQIQLMMSLTDNKTKRAVWSENFERDSIGNPLQLQSKIAEGIVSSMERQVLHAGFAGELAPISEIAAYVRRALGTSATEQLPEKPTQNSVAWNYFMRGTTLHREESAAAVPQAVRAFELAVQEDPRFALAYAEMALAQAALINFNIVPDLDAAESARRSAEKAVDLDPQLPEAFVALGVVRLLELDWTGAEQSLREALRLRPGFSQANQWLAGLVIQFARFGDAVAAARAAIQEDPYNSICRAGCGLYIFFSGLYKEALAILEPAVQGKELPGVRHNLGQLYARLGQLTRGAESEEWFRKAFVEAQTVQEIELRTAPPDSRWPHLFADRMFGLFYAMQGDRERARPYYERLVDAMHSQRMSPVVVSWIPAQFGDAGESLDLLDLAMTYRDRNLHLIRVYPFLERLHGEPRFERLLKQLRLV
jgi:serine/threonine-protein kinase